jgi:hypothetical protein
MEVVFRMIKPITKYPDNIPRNAITLEYFINRLDCMGIDRNSVLVHRDNQFCNCPDDQLISFDVGTGVIASEDTVLSDQEEFNDAQVEWCKFNPINKGGLKFIPMIFIQPY